MLLFFDRKMKIFYSFAVLFSNARILSRQVKADLLARGWTGRPVCRQAGALDEILDIVWVYAISSLNFNYIYVGISINVNERVERHNSGRERTTRHYAPYKLIYVEECENRIEARKREKYWKSGVGKEQLRELRNKKLI
ncbi:MAG: GIY-YIG nuclease family protein [Maribacter sp.]